MPEQTKSAPGEIGIASINGSSDIVGMKVTLELTQETVSVLYAANGDAQLPLNVLLTKHLLDIKDKTIEERTRNCSASMRADWIADTIKCFPGVPGFDFPA